MNTNEAYSRLREVVHTIRKNFMEDGYMVDPHEIELANDLDPNEQQLHSEMHGALSSLETVCELLAPTMKCLFSPRANCNGIAVDALSWEALS